ncbi:hypothetical protein V6Z11_A07G141100 [Gossypium hirsutum]
MSLSTASEGRPIISNVFSHTSNEVSTLCASSEGFVGRQSWEMNAQTGHSSAFSNSQYSGIWGSVAEKRALLEPTLILSDGKISSQFPLFVFPLKFLYSSNMLSETIFFASQQNPLIHENSSINWESKFLKNLKKFELTIKIGTKKNYANFQG